ncbi:MAG: NAD-dependent epimerase/dehydratase family protein [Alphaproteobacteria bacterium]
MRIVVTGASGFVGRALCARLLSDGHTVVAAVRAAGAAPAGTRPVVVGDLAAPVDWSPALAGADALVHLAARVHVVRDTASDPDAAFAAVNVHATGRLFAAARAAGVGRAVFASSVKALAEASGDRPLRDDDAPAPMDAYGRSKRDGEAAVAASGVPTAILRPPLVYGAGVTGNLATLARLVRRGVPLPVAGIANRRSLIGVGNLVGAIAFCLARPETAGRRLLVADVDLSTEAIVRALAAADGRRPRLLPAPPILFAILRGIGAGALVDRLAGSLQVDSGAIRALGWRPEIAPDREFAALMAALDRPAMVGSPPA